MKTLTLTADEVSLAYNTLRVAYSQTAFLLEDAKHFPKEFAEGTAAEAQEELELLQSVLVKLITKE